MSRYKDINQLLQEIGTSARSASDPWTISRSDQGAVKRGAFNPAVVADMGAPAQDLISEIQASERITQADIAPSSSNGGQTTGGGSSGSSGILGGLLNLFPFASGIARLFGFGGGSSAPPVPTPYELPPSISFQGAMTGETSGITSLSYGSNGLPRTTATQVSNFVTSPVGMISNVTGPQRTGGPSGSDGNNSASVLGQIGLLSNNGFAPGPTAAGSNLSADLVSAADGPGPALNASSSGIANSSSGSSSAAAGNSPATQQGQSILVQVQAMDSQSFMDHSHDIAQAVRLAMLNLHSVNDVILDL